jgi:hypothetical protein
MTQPIGQFSTAEEVREFLSANAFDDEILVLSPEVLAQIQAAEEAGGFEGGMSGADGTSQPGSSGPSSSDGSEETLLDFDIEGAWTSEGILHFVEGVGHLASGVAEAAHWIAERGITPIVIVPLEELKRLVGTGTPDEA